MVLAAVILAMGLAAWRPIPVGVWHDDGVYALVGRALAEGHGFSYHGVVGAPPAVKFPPVYPSFVAGLWRIFGDVGTVTLVATLSNVLFLAVAGSLLAWGLRSAAGVPRPVALAAGGVAAVSADVLRTSSAVLSEPLFLLLATGCLASWTAVETRDGGRGTKLWLVVGALMLITVWTRAAGLALVAGFGLAALLKHGSRTAAMIAVPPLAAWAGWSAWAAARGAVIPADLADLLGPYEGWLREQVVQDPVGFAALLTRFLTDIAPV